jgi:hypothetical protein
LAIKLSENILQNESGKWLNIVFVRNVLNRSLLKLL